MYLKYVLCLCCILIVNNLYAQDATLTINGSNLTTEVSTSVNSFSSGCLLTIAPSIKLQANSNFNPSTVALSKVKVFVSTIGGTASTSLLGTATEQTLSTAVTTLFSGIAGLSLSNSSVVVRYRIPQTEMINFGWTAGSYVVPLTYTTPGQTLCLGTQTFSRNLTITVDPYLNIGTAPANVTLTVNSFSFFRSGGISATNNFVTTHTSPYNIGLKANSSVLTHTPIFPNTAVDPSVAYVSAQGTAAIALSTTRHDLLSAPRTPVAGNQFSESITFAITSANLKAHFQSAGTYAVPLAYTLYDTRGTSPLAADLTPAINLTINVSDMGELLVNNAEVNLSFLSAADYVSGVFIDKPAHLRISKTIPYDIYVKASASVLNGTSGNIPTGAITIGPASGQTGVATVTLTNAFQLLVSAAQPVTDRDIAIRYAIPAANVPQLFSKTPGTYTTTVTYSFTSL